MKLKLDCQTILRYGNALTLNNHQIDHTMTSEIVLPVGGVKV